MIQSIEEGRKEDGNRSIADKIIKRLHDLDKTVENNQGRWAWELLQNAKDSIAEHENRTVSVQIELDNNKVEFRHNGIHFTEQDVRGLINQISSKEIEEGQQSQKTGRFGTGFLTTHLLSRVIQVKGIIETTNNEFYTFEFPLDREGKTTVQLIPKIENAWAEFHKSTQKINANYNNNNFNTSFCYHLSTQEQKEIAKIGVEEFIKLIPFVLAFIPRISRVEIIDNTIDKRIVFENKQKKIDDLIIPISKIENKSETNVFILHTCDDKVAIATEIEKTEKGYSIKSIKDIPKLFCDFPLIGSQNFHFPVIINSFFFNPQTERDGVWLKGNDDIEVEENQGLFENALELYKNLLSKITEKEFFDLFNLAVTKTPVANEKYFDDVWFRENIQKALREAIFDSKLVELEDAKSDKQTLRNLWFPLKSYSHINQKKLWQFTYDLFPNLVCRKDHVINWSEISWDDWQNLNYNTLATTISKQEKIENICKTLNEDINKSFDWLNSFSEFLLQEENNLILFDKYSIIPNQNGIFKKKAELYIDKIEDEDLVDILKLLGEDWRDILLHKNVSFGKYLVKTKKDLAVKITEKLKGSINYNENSIKAISLLSEWFENNREIGKELFSEIYRKRAELFMNTISDKDSLYKVMRSKTDLAQLSKVAQAIEANPQLLENIKKAEELSNLLKEFNATDVAELKRMLLLAQGITSNNLKSEITQDILVSLGVTSIAELEEALKDKDLASMFSHSSTPNVNMFLYVQKLISRSKNNVIQHLQALPNYDCTDIEELASTVIGGIKKDGLAIHVVIRPSDNGEVIIYYSSERDTLDYENAELWIDNGRDAPRHLTLGKILKTTGINKIPV